jgi:hypothetical protein
MVRSAGSRTVLVPERKAKMEKRPWWDIVGEFVVGTASTLWILLLLLSPFIFVWLCCMGTYTNW